MKPNESLVVNLFKARKSSFWNDQPSQPAQPSLLYKFTPLLGKPYKTKRYRQKSSKTLIVPSYKIFVSYSYKKMQRETRFMVRQWRGRIKGFYFIFCNWG